MNVQRSCVTFQNYEGQDDLYSKTKDQATAVKPVCG